MSVVGRPDIGLTLRKTPPATSYGVPTSPVINIPPSGYLPPFQPPSVSPPVQFYTGSSDYSATSHHASSQQESSQSYYTTQQADVEKHVYFYEAPQEREGIIQPTPIHFPPPKKNIKIIFIKAPYYPAPTLPNIPLPPQDEEKTIVYVLVKKPDHPSELKIVTPPPTPPSKPEVYFIKYKDHNEAQDKIHDALSGVNVITNENVLSESSIGTESESASGVIITNTESSGPSVSIGTVPAHPTYLPPSDSGPY